MRYEIDFDRPLGEEVRRIGSELLTDAIEQLHTQPQGPHEAVHDARKNIKRVRALYRLVQSDAGDFARDENRRLRAIARDLSHFRDAAAIAETTDYLEQQTDGRETKAAVHRLGKLMKARRDGIARQQHDLEKTLATCCIGIAAATSALGGLRLPTLRKQAIRCLADGWGKTSKRARKALSSCDGATDDEPYHDLRKRSQDRFMHAALLRDAWPSGMISIQRQAKALVDILGHEHDLAVLQDQMVAQDDIAPDDQQHLLAAIVAERARLQLAARKTGADIFIDGHKHDAKIVALLIRNRS